MLDVGCGGELLADLLRIWSDALLFDFDPVAVGVEVDAARHADDARIQIVQSSVEKVDSAPALQGVEIDLAICHLDLALRSDPVRGSTAVLSRLSPGGLLSIVGLATAVSAFGDDPYGEIKADSVLYGLVSRA
ncbi:hypothetical protein SAMN05421595_0178 [Austwickia chelonae]|uniref:Methyltransferase domain-containing protein n=1 Tax=Austwickia chelonae NBRC 105200 TaxID=1184607 RepID=K6WAT5_9MICO|nr:hypothetical protein [Austwickia chelonae]GAB78962.1 hypothetical protein AUCHE_17_01770 [Austwickia chelonae NBRC 105200]SEV87392.1 hypothetical protein SAMN05421595_0178 [Austwickia chelonae]